MKSLPIFKDNGFYYIPLKDSVDQFTIKHSKIIQSWPINDSSLIRQFASTLKNETFENFEDKYVIDTVLTINNKPFAVIGFKSFDTANSASILSLKAVTSIEGNIVNFLFESRKTYYDRKSNAYLQNSFEALKTIRISNGR